MSDITDLKKLPVPLKSDQHGHFIWANTGQYLVADTPYAAEIRGWGYLTGRGALKLSYDQAVEIQRAWQDEIVKRCNLHDELVAVLEQAHMRLAPSREPGEFSAEVHKLADEVRDVLDKDCVELIKAVLAKAKGEA